MGRRLFSWTGPRPRLCSVQRSLQRPQIGNVDGLASTDNKLKHQQRYLFLLASRYTQKQPAKRREPLLIRKQILWCSSLVLCSVCVCVCEEGRGRDGLPCEVHALRQRLHLPEEQASGEPGARGRHQRRLQQQGAPRHLQRFLVAVPFLAAAGAAAGGLRLQRGGVRSREGGREPERRVAGGGEDQGRRHLPAQEERLDRLRREGHRRPDQHLLRRADGVRGGERHQLRRGGHVGGGGREHGGHRGGARPHHRRRGLVHPHPGQQEQAAGAGGRVQRPAAQLLRRQVPARGGGAGAGASGDPRGPRPRRGGRGAGRRRRRGGRPGGDVHRRGFRCAGGRAAVIVS